MEWLVGTMPAGTSLDVDVVCHSRGGLVARSLTEWDRSVPDGRRQIRVHRTALVGTANNGTILADVHHWHELVDTLSTVLNTVGITAGATVDLILSFVRQIARRPTRISAASRAWCPAATFLKDVQRRPRGSAST